MNASEHPIEVFARTAGLLGDAVVREFERVWPTASVDIYRPVLTDVLNGLLGRQVRFFAVAADDPHFWQPDFGGIVLRSMTDTLISLRYIGRGGVEIAQRFRDYSMGHVKLQKLHIEKLVDSGALPGDWEDRVDALQRMVDLDRWEEVIPIDIAGWTPESARDLAIATGLKAQYDLFYAPGSADIHGEWVSLAESVVTLCRQPLHRGHFVPRRQQYVPQHPRFLLNALDLLDLSFGDWTGFTGGTAADYHGEAATFRAAAEPVLETLAEQRRQRRDARDAARGVRSASDQDAPSP